MRLRGAVHQRRFGDLEAQIARPQTGGLDRLLNHAEEVLVLELPARYVDRDVVEAGVGNRRFQSAKVAQACRSVQLPAGR